MFDRSIGRFKINNEEVPIFYKNGKFFLSFRKLRNSVNDGVYSMIISGNVTMKINALKRYIAE